MKDCAQGIRRIHMLSNSVCETYVPIQFTEVRIMLIVSVHTTSRIVVNENEKVALSPPQSSITPFDVRDIQSTARPIP